MDSKAMLSMSLIQFLIRRTVLSAILVLGTLQVALPQPPTGNQDAKGVLRLSDTEQRLFVNSILDASFPEDEGDKFALLLVNRSAFVVPMLESRVEQELKQSPRSARLVELASAMIAYAGDEQSLRAVGKLIAIDENRFGPLVERTLDNAGNWRNPFDVAYRSLEMGDETISRHTATWADSALASNRMRRAWAEAMLERYGKVLGESEWSTDPIAARLKDGASPELRQSVLSFATEAQRERNRQ
jgi:hypothetical protein